MRKWLAICSIIFCMFLSGCVELANDYYKSQGKKLGKNISEEDYATASKTKPNNYGFDGSVKKKEPKSIELSTTGQSQNSTWAWNTSEPRKTLTATPSTSNSNSWGWGSATQDNGSSDIDKTFLQNIDNLNSLSQNDSAVAVIIGNRNYSNQGLGVPDVDFAHNDATVIKSYVTKGLGYREGNIIDLRDATQANLVSVFGNKDNFKGKLYNWVRPQESDVFVFYSGHGAPSLSSGEGYLLPVNADPNTVDLNGYSLSTLYKNLNKLPARSLTIIIDACFSGSSQAGAVVQNASSIILKQINTKNTLPKASILTAAGVSEVASWDQETKLGLFTRHFLEGVSGKADQNKFGNGDGKVTLKEVRKYLESEVTYMARRLYNREQHPQISGPENRVLASN